MVEILLMEMISASLLQDHTGGDQDCHGSNWGKTVEEFLVWQLLQDPDMNCGN